MKFKNAAHIVSFNVAILILLLVFIELFSFGALNFFAAVSKQTFPESYQKLGEMTFAKERLFRTHKAVSLDFYTVSEDGFRSHWSHKKSPLALYNKKEVNVFAFGGSSTFGTGVKDNETWPYILEQLLQKKNKNIHVYNFGIGGFSTHDETYLLTQLLINGYVPDTAVFLDGVNQACPAADRSASYRSFFENPIVTLLRNSNTYRLLNKIVNKFWKKPAIERNPDLTQEEFQSCAKKEYINYAEYIDKLSQQFGFQVFFNLQPSGVFLDNYKNYNFLFYGNPDDAVHEFYNKYYDAMMQETPIFLKKKIRDLRYLLNFDALKNGNLFVDWSHPTKEGNEIIAKEIFKIIDYR